MLVPSQEIKEDARQRGLLYAQSEAVTVTHAANTAHADSIEWSTWQAAPRWLNQPGLRNVLALKGLYPSESQAQELLTLGRDTVPCKLRFLFPLKGRRDSHETEANRRSDNRPAARAAGQNRKRDLFARHGQE